MIIPILQRGTTEAKTKWPALPFYNTEAAILYIFDMGVKSCGTP